MLPRTWWYTTPSTKNLSPQTKVRAYSSMDNRKMIVGPRVQCRFAKSSQPSFSYTLELTLRKSASRKCSSHKRSNRPLKMIKKLTRSTRAREWPRGRARLFSSWATSPTLGVSYASLRAPRAKEYRFPRMGWPSASPTITRAKRRRTN